MNERHERAARDYMNQTGVSLATARVRVREALGRSGQGNGSKKGCGSQQRTREAAVGGRKHDRADDAAVILDRSGLGGYEREVVFHPTRKWRLDFYWPESNVALEIEGRLPPWVDARNVSHHTSWSGYSGDCLKYSEAAVMGIAVIRCTTEMMNDGTMVDLVGRATRPREVKAGS